MNVYIYSSLLTRSKKLSRSFRNFSFFKVIDISPERGKGVFATQNLLPGQVLFCESPIIDTSLRLKDSHPAYRAAYILFAKLESERQSSFMTMFGPTTDGPNLVDVKHEAKLLKRLYPKRQFDFEKFVSICIHNQFGGDDDELTQIYELTSRISHSCSPNIALINLKKKCADSSWVVGRPIAEGEELTISYLGMQSTIDATWDRRDSQLQAKNFLCQCPRCTDPADDTRQFNCFDKMCSGRHFACQPLITDTPYLLPCNVCKQPPPADYDNIFDTVEKQLPTLLDSMSWPKRRPPVDEEPLKVPPRRAAHYYYEDGTTDEDEEEEEEPIDKDAEEMSQEELCRIDNEIDRVMRTSYHPYHSHFTPILRRFAQHFSQTKQYGLLKRVAEDMVGAFESRKIATKDAAICSTAGMYMLECIESTDDNLPIALRFLRRAVRDHLLFYGRENREIPVLESTIRSLLYQLPSENIDLTQCAFCCETISAVYAPTACKKSCGGEKTKSGMERAFCSQGCRDALR